MSLDEAATIVDVIAATFGTGEFTSIGELLGETGTWVGHVLDLRQS